jgi:hypothetical protein
MLCQRLELGISNTSSEDLGIARGNGPTTFALERLGDCPAGATVPGTVGQHDAHC